MNQQEKVVKAIDDVHDSDATIRKAQVALSRATERNRKAMKELARVLRAVHGEQCQVLHDGVLYRLTRDGVSIESCDIVVV